jgi:DNA mismatch endonuclease (patch repair protein)
VPKRNRDFWEAKFAANRARDARNVEALEALGYHVVVIWQCETEDGECLEKVLDERLETCPSSTCHHR